MSCAPLASTGGPVLAMIGVGAVVLAVGVVLVLVSRRGRVRLSGTAVVLLLATGTMLVFGRGSTPARADPADCAAATGTQFVIPAQTSTMNGLAPGVDPVAITGIVTNTDSVKRFVVAVTVRITGVVGVHSGTCTASDYVLLDVVMPVGVTLDPGGSTDFSGARIGFRDKTINQDACQSAVVHLRYVVS